MGHVVRRPHRSMVIIPRTTCGAHFRVSIRCGKCHVPRPISIIHSRYAKVWEIDRATIFEKVRFRCRCGSLANALKVERHTHGRPEEMLFVQVPTGDGCDLSG